MSTSFNWQGIEGSSKISEYLNSVSAYSPEDSSEDEKLENSFIDTIINSSIDNFESRFSDEYKNLIFPSENSDNTIIARIFKLLDVISSKLFWMRLGILSFVMITLFVISTVCYILIYQWIVPNYLHSIPISFDFSQEKPTVNMSILSLLRAKQEYSFTLHLLIPDSPKNAELGNFMVEFSILNSNNFSVFYSKKPVFEFFNEF